MLSIIRATAVLSKQVAPEFKNIFQQFLFLSYYIMRDLQVAWVLTA